VHYLKLYFSPFCLGTTWKKRASDSAHTVWSGNWKGCGTGKIQDRDILVKEEWGEEGEKNIFLREKPKHEKI